MRNWWWLTDLRCWLVTNSSQSDVSQSVKMSANFHTVFELLLNTCMVKVFCSHPKYFTHSHPLSPGQIPNYSTWWQWYTCVNLAEVVSWSIEPTTQSLNHKSNIPCCENRHATRQTFYSTYPGIQVAQWLSGRALNLQSLGLGFDSHSGQLRSNLG